MKNGLMLSVLLGILGCIPVQAEMEDQKITLTFPDVLYKSYYLDYPCQLYSEVEENDGTRFAYVKINRDPYEVVPGNIVHFRNKDYIIKSIQVADQEDFSEVIPNLISVEMKPYEEDEYDVPNNMYSVIKESKSKYQIVYYDPDGILQIILPTGIKADTFKTGELIYLAGRGLYEITNVQDSADKFGFFNRTLIKLNIINEDRE